jgi:hypothetical protein
MPNVKVQIKFKFQNPNGNYFDWNVGRKTHLEGGVKGHNIKGISFPGSPGLCLGSFTFGHLTF